MGKKRRYRGLGLVAGLVGVGLGVLAGGTATAAAVEPEDGVGGYGLQRIESEYSIHVPDEIVESVWSYLAATYGGGGSWPAGLDSGSMQARLSDEDFIDRYFDTPDLKVLASGNGIRHRSRDIPGVPDDPKDDRQLVQIKVTANGDTVKRGEYKFPVRRSLLKSPSPPNTPLALVKRSYHDGFRRVTAEMGIDADRLKEVLTLKQHRRRVYYRDAQGPMMTVTLDQVDTKKLWARAGWTEMELELGEIRYTEASPEERAHMERLRDVIRADLLARFPTLHQDDQPKYTEAFARVERELPFLRQLVAVRGHRATVPTLWAAGVSGLLVLSASLVVKRQRGSWRLRQS